MELIRDPNGPYSQLVHLQEATNQSDDARKVDKICERENTLKRSRSHNFSDKSVSIGSSNSHHSASFSFGVPSPIGMDKVEVNRKESIQQGQAANGKRPKVSLRRLVCLNKSELPVLLLGTIAAAVHGLIFPMFAFSLSTAIKIFYEPPNRLQKDSEFWALLFVGLGVLTLIVGPLQNFLFGVAGGKLIERVRALSFEKVVHQEITWFDQPENSRSVK